ncbi:hypothetical protein [Brachybacterium sp. UNK5269]|uniref:hypothetical protein n=1 Tax=Brachybacterium sp. UNK5269 TaxID=3408576 RepID=UPI003BB0CB05
MIVTADQGPVGFPTSKDGAGFLAPSALRYELEAGQSEAAPLPTAEGDPQLRGRVVRPGDVLRWFVHPVLDADHTWGATHVAVDLVFEDGTRLSEFEPRDQYGTLATARGLGEGRILYADQWNDVQVSLEQVVGRTVGEVLLAVDVPDRPEDDLLDAPDADAAEPAALHGWIDGPHLGPLPRSRPRTTRWPGSTPGAGPTPPRTSPAATRCR